MNRILTTRILVLALAAPLAAQVADNTAGTPTPKAPSRVGVPLQQGQPPLPANPAGEKAPERKALPERVKNPTAQSSRHSKAARHNKPGREKKVGALAASSPVAATPSAPVPITTMAPEQLPPMPPQVSFLNGQLTILAQNSTLGDILTAVQRKTGVEIDVPPGAGSQRLATQVGPASPRDALASLLQGTNLDYIILGNESHPGAISKVLLTVRAGSNAPGAAVAGNNPLGAAGGGRPGQAPPMPAAGNFDAGEDDSVTSEPPPEPVPVEQPGEVPMAVQGGQSNPPQPGQPVMPPAPLGEPQSAGQGPNGESAMQPQQPQVKTQGQYVQELQRMQQQQPQQQQQNPEQPQ